MRDILYRVRTLHDLLTDSGDNNLRFALTSVPYATGSFYSGLPHAPQSSTTGPDQPETSVIHHHVTLGIRAEDAYGSIAEEP